MSRVVAPSRLFLVMSLAVAILSVVAVVPAPVPAGATVPGAPGDIFIATFTGPDWDLATASPTATTLLWRDARNDDYQPAPSPDGSHVAFVRRPAGQDTGAEIWVARRDGADQRRLTDSAGENNSPAWSPDGTGLAFVSDRGGDADLYVMNADGSGQHAIAGAPAQEVEPSWAPDNSEIAFRSGTDVHAIHPDGTGERLVLASASQPDWAPSSETLAFTTNGPSADDGKIEVAARDGSGRRTVAGVAGMCATSPRCGEFVIDQPTWSPAGDQLAYRWRDFSVGTRIEVVKVADRSSVWASGFGGSPQGPRWSVVPRPLPVNGPIAALATLPTGEGIVLVEPSNSQVTTLTSGASATDAAPSFSADGSQLAFRRSPRGGGDGDIWLMRKDGTRARPLVTGAGNDDRPDWAPDGRRVVFSSNRGGPTNLYLVDADGQNLVKLTNGPGADTRPRWSPDGLLISYVHTDPGASTSTVRLVTVSTGATGELSAGTCAEWNPDGASLLVGRPSTSETGASGSDYYIVSRDGTSSRLLSSVQGPVVQLCSFAWSPDGGQLAVVRFDPARSTTDIRVQTPEGDSRSGYVAEAGHPDWGTRVTAPVGRVFGEDRIATAIALSASKFTGGTAGGAVVARADAFPDALSAAPLAVVRNGPVLLTRSDALDARVAAELQRAVPAGAAVSIVGGPAAVSAAVEEQVRQLGYAVTRYAGATRAETAVDVAERGLGGRTPVLLSTGLGFADALSGGAAAAAVGGVVLLTDGTAPNAATTAYLAAHPGQQYALGGAAAAAYPTATPVVGADRYATSAMVAARFFRISTAVFLASGSGFPDALAAGAIAGGAGSPLLLTDGTELSGPTREHLEINSATIAKATVAGGTAVITDAVMSAAQAAIS